MPLYRRGELRYKHYIPLVQVMNAQASTETQVAGMNAAARITYLTNYTAQRATQAQNLAAGLRARMP